MVHFEFLPSELILHSFEYLNTVDLLRSFFNLNSRFNQLIYLHFEINQFSLQSISLENFHLISRIYLPLIVKHVPSLRLSSEETPNVIEILLSQGFTLDRFLHLQSLSLHHIKSLGILVKITYQCRHLPYLSHLNIIDEKYGEKQARIFTLFDNIWTIPNLKHCSLNGIQKKLIVPFQISSISTTMKTLSIKNVHYGVQALFDLLLCTPNLEHLCTTLGSYSSNEFLEFQNHPITSLDVSFDIFSSSMKNIFEKLSNLTHLKIKLTNTYLDGNEWKEIIETNLPKIKIFRFKMSFEFVSNVIREEQVDLLLNTFRSSFWIEQHQWFVRCRWNPSNSIKSVIIYTLPYTFDSFHYSNEYCEKSTYFDDTVYRSYNHVQLNYYHKIDTIDSFNDFNLFNIRFPNIHYLSVNIPFDNMFLYSGQTFNNLRSLVVFLSMDTGYYQLQLLLDQTKYLYSLKIISNNKVHHSLFHLTNQSIRRLDLMKCSMDGLDYFDEEECKQLIDSSLGKQCEVLLIRIFNRETILHFIHKMTNLRLLILEWKKDSKILKYFKCQNDELLEWLRNHLLTTCSIVRDQKSPSRVQIWINRREFLSNSHILVLKDRRKFFRSIKSTFPRLFRKSSFYQ